MKGRLANLLLVGLAIAVMAFLASCTKVDEGDHRPLPDQLKQAAYEWELARMNNDIDRQMELLYVEYGLASAGKKVDSGLQYSDIAYELYLDKANDQYIVFLTYASPFNKEAAHSPIVLRDDGGLWKVDLERSLSIDRDALGDSVEPVV